jgi:hypothetical protein
MELFGASTPASMNRLAQKLFGTNVPAPLPLIRTDLVNFISDFSDSVKSAIHPIDSTA